MVCMKDYDPWSIPYRYNMEVQVVVWCIRLVLQPKEKFILLTSRVVVDFGNPTSLQNCCERTNMNHVDFCQVMINHQG